MVSASSGSRRNYAASCETGGARCSRNGWPSVILSREQSTVLACGLLMLHLRRDWSAVRFVSPGLLLRRRTRAYSALSTVVCHMRIVVYDDGLVINIGDVGDVNVGHRPVVEEFAAAPFAALEAFAEVSEAVVDAAVESDVRTPIADVPEIDAIVPTPVSGGPQISNFGSYHPGAGHPVVAVIVAPGPITRGPDIARARAKGLLVNRQCRRANSHRNAEADLCSRWRRKSRWNNQQQESERQEPQNTLQLHLFSSCPLGLPGNAAPEGLFALTLAANRVRNQWFVLTKGLST
jgi:hypothetical protein